MCIWQSKNAVYGSMFYEWKKSLNVQEMHKTLHILGSLIVFPVVLKLPFSVSTSFHI